MNSPAEIARFFGPNLIYFFAGLLIPSGLGTALAWVTGQVWPAAWENRQAFAFLVFIILFGLSLRYTRKYGHPTVGDQANCLAGLCFGVGVLMGR